MFVIGYSLPTDRSRRRFTARRGLIGRTVVVVNRSPNDVVARIESFTNGARRPTPSVYMAVTDAPVDIHVVDGADAVHRFASAFAVEVEDEDPRRASVVRPN